MAKVNIAVRGGETSCTSIALVPLDIFRMTQTVGASNKVADDGSYSYDSGSSNGIMVAARARRSDEQKGPSPSIISF